MKRASLMTMCNAALASLRLTSRYLFDKYCTEPIESKEGRALPDGIITMRRHDESTDVFLLTQQAASFFPLAHGHFQGLNVSCDR